MSCNKLIIYFKRKNFNSLLVFRDLVGVSLVGVSLDGVSRDITAIGLKSWAWHIEETVGS